MNRPDIWSLSLLTRLLLLVCVQKIVAIPVWTERIAVQRTNLNGRGRFSPDCVIPQMSLLP